VIIEVVESSSPRVRAIKAGFVLATVLVILYFLPGLRFWIFPCPVSGFHRGKDINLLCPVYSSSQPSQPAVIVTRVVVPSQDLIHFFRDLSVSF
jgi:hypothetical protein